MVVASCGWLWVVVDGCWWLWMVVGGCGWLWVIADGFGWLWVVAYFSINQLIFTLANCAFESLFQLL